MKLFDLKFAIYFYQKAYAKFYGSYGSLKGGNAIAAMVDFSGGFSEEYYTKDLSPDELFSTTIETFEKSSLMTCSTATVNEVITGLMSNHVYTITRGRITFDCYSRVHVYCICDNYLS